MSSNITRVQAIYSAFGAGDSDAVLAALSPDVRWSNAGPKDLDYFGVRNGRQQVTEVLAILGQDFDIAEFSPIEFFETGDRVAVLLHLKAAIRSTRIGFEEDLVHVWTFGSDGLVASLQDIQDSATVAAALRG